MRLLHRDHKATAPGYRRAPCGWSSCATANGAPGGRDSGLVDRIEQVDDQVAVYFEGRTLVPLHHRGAKTGAERLNPLAYQRLDDDSVAVFASKGGDPKNPDWYYNLVANPDAEVEIGIDRVPVLARVAEGEERDRIFEKQKADWDAFSEYEETLEGIRVIPVVVLET